MNVDAVTEMNLQGKGELTDVFDGTERVVAVVIQRPYMRQVDVPLRPGQWSKRRHGCGNFDRLFRRALEAPGPIAKRRFSGIRNLPARRHGP
jgi:hypothetical protein